MTPTPPPIADLIDSTPWLDNADELRRRGEEHGYLFFRGLLPEADILTVRRALLSVLDAHDLLAAGADPLSGRLDVDAIARIPEDAMRLDIGVSTAIYEQAQKLQEVHRLPHHPRLLALYETLFGRDVLVHPRHIVRMVTPHPAMVPTPVHQDFPLIQGTPETWTCWFPIGDCPKAQGVLAVMPESHRLGCLPVQPMEGAGGIQAQLCPGEDRWHSTDFRAGDVLTFPSYTVHKALPCQTPGRVRLSFDVRYQPADLPVHENSLRPHCELTWEQVYADWSGGEDLKYYWQASSPTLSPWDDTLDQPRRRIC